MRGGGWNDEEEEEGDERREIKTEGGDRVSLVGFEPGRFRSRVGCCNKSATAA